jgi:hypothetical protein
MSFIGKDFRFYSREKIVKGKELSIHFRTFVTNVRNVKFPANLTFYNGFHVRKIINGSHQFTYS